MATALAGARRHGVKAHARVAWVRRKFGGDVTVWRPVGGLGQALGVSTPCPLCRRTLIEFGLRVHCCVDAEAQRWYHGHLDEPRAPVSKPTSGQARVSQGSVSKNIRDHEHG